MPVDANAAVPDLTSTAWVSGIPGFVNRTIGASNINSLAVSYTACQAPITFTNSLRAPTQPSVSNGALRISYSYYLTDGSSYWVSANLTITTSSAFATTQDQLGNPYQTVVNITGTRTYFHIPTGQSLVAQLTGISLVRGTTQRFYPYSLLASSPSLYNTNTTPYLDSSVSASPSCPVLPSTAHLSPKPRGCRTVR